MLMLMALVELRKFVVLASLILTLDCTLLVAHLEVTRLLLLMAQVKLRKLVVIASWILTVVWMRLVTHLEFTIVTLGWLVMVLWMLALSVFSTRVEP